MADRPGDARFEPSGGAAPSASASGDPLSALANPPDAPPHQIEWYHPDPDQEYHELRADAGPIIWRGLFFGGLLSALAVGLFYACMWMVAPSAAMLGSFEDRTVAQAREDLPRHLGNLAPPLAAITIKPLLASTQPMTAEPATAPSAPGQFVASNLRAAHRADQSGNGGGHTWYRFDLPPDEVGRYADHFVTTWLKELKHRTMDARNDAAFDGTGAPPWWNANESDPETRVRLELSSGQVLYHAAFNAKSGHVYIRVNH
jgi:hypothetical protein